MAGRVEKEKQRKERMESRLAQRTGKSTLDRHIEKLIKAIKEGKIKPVPMPKKGGIGGTAPNMKDWFKKQINKSKESESREERLRLLGKAGGNAKGGKLKHGGKAKKKYGVVGKPTLKKGGKAK